MFRGKNLRKVIVIAGCLMFAGCLILSVEKFVTAEEAKTKKTDWKVSQKSLFFNQERQTALMQELPDWDIQTMIWPPKSELETCLAVATEVQKHECLVWLKRFIKKELVPADINEHLLPLKEWAKLDKNWKKNGKEDVFMTKYQIGDYLIHIVDAGWRTIVTVTKTDTTPSMPKEAHVDFVSKIIALFCRKQPTKIELAAKQGSIVTEGGILGLPATFITDGKFVRFEMTKLLKGPRAFPPLYRFSPLIEYPRLQLKGQPAFCFCYIINAKGKNSTSLSIRAKHLWSGSVIERL